MCLQHEYQHEGVSESDWRMGFKLRPYIFDAARIIARMDLPSGAQRPAGLEFVHFPSELRRAPVPPPRPPRAPGFACDVLGAACVCVRARARSR